MSRPVKVTDPVAGDQEQREQIEQESQFMTIDDLTMEDFQPVPVQAARQPHPFEGYPQKKMKIGTYMEKGKPKDLIVNLTHIVAMNPKEYVHQDPSGKGLSIESKGQEVIVDLQTYHNRIVIDQMGRNTTVVFDRDILLGDGRKMTRVAICPDHTARAQLCFMIDKITGQVIVDRRYVFADSGQFGRLRQVFNAFYYQQTKSERLAQKFDAEQESAAQ